MSVRIVFLHTVLLKYGSLAFLPSSSVSITCVLCESTQYVRPSMNI